MQAIYLLNDLLFLHSFTFFSHLPIFSLFFSFFSCSEPPILKAHNNTDIILRLPMGKRIKDIRWLSVWCRRFTVFILFTVFDVVVVAAVVDVIIMIFYSLLLLWRVLCSIFLDSLFFWKFTFTTYVLPLVLLCCGYCSWLQFCFDFIPWGENICMYVWVCVFLSMCCIFKEIVFFWGVSFEKC